MRSKKVTPLSRVVVKTMLGVTDALDAGHLMDPMIVHSDVKSQNVMVCSKGRVLLIDYSQSMSGPGDEHMLSGSPGYMAPEILLGDGDAYDPKRDIYACGVIISESMTQMSPFICSGMGLEFTLDANILKFMQSWKTPKDKFYRNRAKDLLHIADECLMAYRGGIDSASKLREALQSWQDAYTRDQGNFYK